MNNCKEKFVTRLSLNSDAFNLALRLTNRSVFHWPVNRLSVWEKKGEKIARSLSSVSHPFPPSPRDFFHPFPIKRDCSQANILQQQIDCAFKKMYLEENNLRLQSISVH